MIIQFNIVVVLACISFVENSHFRGDTITWRPFNSTPSGSTVDIQIRQRYSWNRPVYFCDDVYIVSLGVIRDLSSVFCVSGTCSNWNSNRIYTQTYCTDYSFGGVVSSGEVYYTRTVPLNAAFSSGDWLTNLVIGGGGLWSLVSLINTIVRAYGIINSSPIATTLPAI
ncbi:unnamed protein product [Rotaria socialis]|uniref:Uncharacterized protein n=1 Tax=Rotaria socialis TaxID=392032 RepID=A0A821M942_9BILA|nr:unnamed protein product [Rotaria socialis]CAF3379875.1 unnamed protein product [Rotaria socialis]CAF3567758.1 unnamed protein product [Rotaria socialis]CAF3757293.1 unnamed protein product [Rotaria socialis]CAF4524643.1 unnamed protein product [Rotaria socialis]